MKRLLTLCLLLLLCAPLARAEDAPTYVFPYEGFRFTAEAGERVLTQQNLAEHADLLSQLGTTPEVMLSSFVASQTVMEVLPEAGGQFAFSVASAGAFSDYQSAARMDEDARAAFLSSFADTGMYRDVAWSQALPEYLTMVSSTLQGDVALYRLTYVTLRHSNLYLMSATVIGREPNEQDARALEALLARVEYLGRLATPEPTATATPVPTPSPTPRPTPGSAPMTHSQEGLTLIVSNLPAWTDEEELLVTGTTMAGASVRLLCGEEQIARASADRGGAFKLRATLPEEGELSLTVTAELSGQAPAYQTYSLRFERRAAQIVVNEPESVVEQSKFYLRGVTEPNATVYAKGPNLSTNVKSNANGVFSVPVTQEKEGDATYELTVKAKGLRDGAASVTITRRFSERERLAAFRSSLSPTTYAQLAADPEGCKGQKLSFRGRIGAFGDMDGMPCMLLYTRNPSRGEWVDPLWIVCDEILSFSEGDILTVYVTPEGTTAEHEEQILPVVRLMFYND